MQECWLSWIMHVKRMGKPSLFLCILLSYLLNQAYLADIPFLSFVKFCWNSPWPRQNIPFSQSSRKWNGWTRSPSFISTIVWYSVGKCQMFHMLPFRPCVICNRMNVLAINMVECRIVSGTFIDQRAVLFSKESEVKAYISWHLKVNASFSNKI